MPQPPVLLFGDINVDLIFRMAELPDPGHDRFAEHAETHLGGAVCNTAVLLQRIGQPARLLGAIGDDAWSDYVSAELSKVPLDTRFVITKPGEQTGMIFIAVTPNGERTMYSHRGANIAMQPEDFSAEVLQGVELLHLSGYDFITAQQHDCAWTLVEMAAARGIPISMDTGLDPVVLMPETIREVLPYVSIVITGAVEAHKLTGEEKPQEQLEQFLSFGVQTVAVKLGEKGAWLGTQEGILAGPAFTVKVVDTTSAGDAFSAGLLYGYMHGFSRMASLLLANALGGLATTVYGAARFGREAVLAFLDRNRVDQIQGYDAADFSEVFQCMGEELRQQPRKAAAF
jgi:ribokinase